MITIVGRRGGRVSRRDGLELSGMVSIVHVTPDNPGYGVAEHAKDSGDPGQD